MYSCAIRGIRVVGSAGLTDQHNQQDNPTLIQALTFHWIWKSSFPTYN